MNHESAMDITSALLGTRFNEPEVPDASIPPEKQAAYSPDQQPPPTIIHSVQFIGIKYVLDSVRHAGKILGAWR
jgi:hypothetical protein